MKKDNVKMTISIPRLLRERMKTHPGINWSAVATKAFDEACTRREKCPHCGEGL